MILYHGTNMDFEVIDLQKCLPHKDFGKGFYLTPFLKRAEERALDKCEKTNEGTPIVLKYEIEEAQFRSLSIKKFEKTDEEWIKFILTNRNVRNKNQHEYDIVIGPVADDGIITSVSLYEAKVIDMQTLINRLKYSKPYVQYCFCSQKAVNLLTKL